MEAPDRIAVPRRESIDDEWTAATDAGVTVHQTTPERFVFTEADNCDGWIATDLAVDLRP